MASDPHGDSRESSPQARSFWVEAMGQLALYRREGEPKPLMGAGKPTALLAYLAVAPDRRADRDRVAELFWRAAEPSDARHSLRQALYRLRSVAGRRLARSHGAELELSPRVRFDFEEGEAALGDGNLERAASLLAGEFMAGFSIPESREFESWVNAERSRLFECWKRAAKALALRSLEDGRPHNALAIADQLAGRYPFNDEPVRLQMAALAAAGRHAAALARFEGYRELLKDELEEEPGDALAGYAEELAGYLKTRGEESRAALPFVGRSREWAGLETAWQAAQEGDGTAILVEAAAGFGKSRILDELAIRVRATGGAVLSAKCYEIDRSVPYAATVEALSVAAGHPALEGLGPAWLAEATRLLPELKDRFSELPETSGEGSPAAKRRLHQALVKLVETVAEEDGALVAVDDIHWADPSTLELLHFLSHRLQDAKAVLLATYRPAELSPAARRFTRSLVADRLAQLVVLEPLEEENVSELLSRLGAFDDPEFAHRTAATLQRHSAGNPLFIAELLELLERRRILWVRDGRWRWSAEAMEEFPHTLGKLLSDRVDGLDPWMRACVEVLAVVADAVQVELLARLVEISEPRAELAVSVLEEERLVKRAGPDTFELIHDELRRLVYQGIPDERRRVLHGVVGSVLETRGEGRRPGGAARLAHHFDQSGEAERAHRYALLAAQEAETLAAPEARRAHLDLADAHAPKALPPRAGGPEPAGWRNRRRVLGAAGVLAGLVLVGAWAGGLFSRSAGPDASAADYRQGTLYLGAGSETSYGYQLVWPDEPGVPGRLRELRRPPEGSPPRIVHQRVNEGGETHGKLFRATGGGLEQITFGPSDDGPGDWSPDGRFLLVQRGWRTEDNRFQANLVLLDSLGNERARLTNTRYQDQWGVWSRTGTRIAVRRDSLDVRTLWLMDADGARARDLTAEFQLPTTEFTTGFSPDEKRLAVAYPDTGNAAGVVFVLDLTSGRRHTLSWPHGARVGNPLLWSPDGHWLAYSLPSGTGSELWTVSANGGEGPYLLAELPNRVVPRAWRGDEDRYVAGVDLNPSVLELRTGEGVGVTARALTPDGEPLDLEFRWSVTDTAVARVDTEGFVVAKRPGTAMLVATPGGLVADTARVTVRLAPVDTLFVEDWSGGLDETRWRPFGQPAPRVVPGGLPDGRPAFFAAGDYNHHSGVLSRAGFVAGEDGYTVEAEARLEFDGRYWQYWDLRLAPDTVRFEAEELAGFTPVSVMIGGPNPTREETEWSACTRGEEHRVGRLGSLGPPDSLHRVAIQVRPDGVVECFLAGTLLAGGTLPASLRASPLLVGLMAQSEFVRLYHGRVVVTRGLRY